MINRYFLLIQLLVVVLFSACNDDGLIDTIAPEITLQNPENKGYMTAGEYVYFKANFSDDKELATYNIEIHENFDGHAHGRIAGVSNDPNLVKWSYNQSFLIPGGNSEFLVETDNDILIPPNTLAGPYHFIVRAIDEAGNATSNQEGSTAEHEVYITNNSQPVISITNLNDDELEIEVGVLFIVTGDITDPTTGEYAGMHAMEIILGEEHDEAHDHGRIAEGELIDFDVDEESIGEFMENGVIVLDKVFESIDFSLSQEQLDELAAEEVDHLFLTIKVHDEQGNIAISNTPVHIHTD